MRFHSLRFLFLASLCLLSGVSFSLGAADTPTDSKYRDYLKTHPDVASAIGISGDKEQRVLDAMLAQLDQTGRLPPPNDKLPAKLSDERLLHLRHAAFALWVDQNEKVPWRLASYSKADLTKLLSFDATIRNPASPTYLKFLRDPDRAFNDGAWVKPTRRESIFAIGDWIKGHIVHMSMNTRTHVTDQPAPDLETFLRGGPVGDCKEIGDFFAAACAALNIRCLTAAYPREATEWAFHRFVDFPADDLFLVHGDDFYSSGNRDAPFDRVLASAGERAEAARLLARDPENYHLFTYRREVRVFLEFGRDPKLISAARTGPDAVYTVLDSMYGAMGRNGERIHYLTPIKAEVMQMIDERLADIKTRKPRPAAVRPKATEKTKAGEKETPAAP